jgi:hypothetical protein
MAFTSAAGTSTTLGFVICDSISRSISLPLADGEQREGKNLGRDRERRGGEWREGDVPMELPFKTLEDRSARTPHAASGAGYGKNRTKS